MIYDREFVGAIARLAELSVDPSDCSSALEELSRSVKKLFGLFGSGVDASIAGQYYSITTSVDPATDLSWFQRQLILGPFRGVGEDGTPVSVGDVLECELRWPEIAAEARGAGIAGIAGIPMRIGTHCVGVLVLYSDKAAQWNNDDLRAVGVLAAVTTACLIDRIALSHSEHRATELDREVQRSIVVEQAKGVTADDRQVSIDQAFRLMEQHARRHNTTVLSVARAIVDVGLRVRP